MPAPGRSTGAGRRKEDRSAGAASGGPQRLFGAAALSVRAERATKPGKKAKTCDARYRVFLRCVNEMIAYFRCAPAAFVDVNDSLAVAAFFRPRECADVRFAEQPIAVRGRRCAAPCDPKNRRNEWAFGAQTGSGNVGKIRVDAKAPKGYTVTVNRFEDSAGLTQPGNEAKRASCRV